LVEILTSYRVYMPRGGGRALNEIFVSITAILQLNLAFTFEMPLRAGKTMREMYVIEM